MRIFITLLLPCFFYSPVTAQQYHWHLALPGAWHSVAFNPLSHGKIIFAGPGGQGGIFRSDDGGVTWQEHAGGPTNSQISDVHQVYCLEADTNIVFAVTSTNFYRSSNGGVLWCDTVLRNGGVDGECVTYHAPTKAVYYGQALAFAGGVQKSTDNGLTWIQNDTTNDSIELCTLAVQPDPTPILLEGSENGPGLIARSTDEGHSWTRVFDGKESHPVEVPKIVFSNYAISPLTNDHGVAFCTRWFAGDSAMVFTLDGGRSWQPMPNVPPRPWALDIDQRQSMVSKTSDPAYPKPLHFFIGLFKVSPDTIPNGLVQETNDGGITWHSMNFPDTKGTDKRIWVLKYDTTSGRIAVATDDGLYIGDTGLADVAEPRSEADVQITNYRGSVEIDAATTIREVIVYDLLGKEIAALEPMQSRAAISTNNYREGTYAIVVRLLSGSTVRRLVHLP